jgi:acetyltransferase
MTIRNLDALFQPKAIALIGASNRPQSVGAVLARNLFETGFEGPIVTVNPREAAVRSTYNYRSVAELPVVPDLAVLATPPDTVPGLIADLGARGCRAAVVVTAGFGEGERAEGEALRQRMLDAAKPYLLRIVGPNCLGFISPVRKINASFSHLTPPKGDLALITQSGAVATALLDWATARGFGFSHVISIGDMADVDFGDLLDYLATDVSTRAILLYVESVTHARKFMSAGRIAARAKPVLVIKTGRSQAGAKAALSHTGALAGADLVYDAAFRRAGMLRVHEMRELFEAVTTLSAGVRAAGDRLAIMTNGGGAGVIAVDALEEQGGSLAELAPETIATLDKALPKAWSRGNPVDILGDAPGTRYGAALDTLLSDKNKDAVLVINCPVAVADSIDAAKAVIEHVPRAGRTPVLTCWLGEGAAAASRKLFSEKKIPAYETPDEAVRAFMHLVRFAQNQDLLLETPPANPDVTPPDKEGAAAVIGSVLDEGRSVLTAPEAKSVLAAYGIPTVVARVASDPAEARKIAADIGRPVALKILSPDISHKSDVGGVRLDLRSPEEVEDAARQMLDAVRKNAPKAKLTGFTVEPMATSRHGRELLAGISVDPTFGPIALFGQGGIATEIIADRAIGLPPLNMTLAVEMIARTRIASLLAGYRDQPPAAVGAVATTLIKLSQIAIDFAEVTEIDINPLVADENGVIAVDARIVVKRSTVSGTARLAIRPYPAELEKVITLKDGRQFTMTPIRPEDEPQLAEMVVLSSPQDVRFRFLAPIKEFPHRMAARLSQIDYSREMAFVARQAPGGPGTPILGVTHILADPDGETAEYAVMVRSDLKGQGLGYAMMQALIAYGHNRGLKTIFGDVLYENKTMLQMADELGFERMPGDDASVVKVAIDLTRPDPAAKA